MNDTRRFCVRVAAPDEVEDGYVARRPDGLPTWTWHAPDPLPLDEAERLRLDALRLCGGTLYIDPADSTPTPNEQL